MSDHARHLRSALELAERGWGRVHPNPLVGALVVRDGVVVGTGCHREFGGAHAEVEALTQAGEAARGATLYVTLEPCCHHGKTPPCTHAIIRSGIATVVFGTADPHPQAGGGADVLRRAGINVVGGVESEAVRQQNALFFHTLEQPAPFVALKLAMSLDARIAGAPGERTRITADEADREVHRLRSGFDAILIGSNTARIDDPLLTVRYAPASIRPPIRIVLDSKATLSTKSALLRTVAEAPVWVVCGTGASVSRVADLERAGARPIVVHSRKRRVPIGMLLERLKAEGVGTILCEGGATVAAALLDANAVDRLYAFIAPVLLGEGGVAAFPVSNPLKSGSWRASRIAQLGNDALLMFDKCLPD
ncbi:MAG: bifunctional diaminohydroxyphosphoribosylaminopyrimidine deaminase/5-amino-6-(5-phosphoribosylamino)uracil reductase RibD [Gemmatimonadota bacterium]